MSAWRGKADIVGVAAYWRGGFPRYCSLIGEKGTISVSGSSPAANRPTNNELRTWLQNFFEFFWRGPVIFRS